MHKNIRSLSCLALVLSGFIILLSVWMRPGGAAPHLKYHQQAVFVSPTDDLAVSQGEFARLGVRIVPSYDALVEWERQENEVRIIYLHPDVLDEVDEQHLRGAYQRGVVLAALNTPVSQLFRVADVSPSLADLPAEYYTSDEYITVAVILHTQDPEERMTGEWVYADFFPISNFADIPRLIESRLAAEEQAAIEAAGCSASPTIDFKVGSWATQTGTLSGIGWTDERWDPVNQKDMSYGHGDTTHNLTANTLRGRVEIWTNCGSTHQVSNSTKTGTWTQAVCDAWTQVDPYQCSADYWANTQHSAQPVVGGYWTVGNLTNINIRNVP